MTLLALQTGLAIGVLHLRLFAHVEKSLGRQQARPGTPVPRTAVTVGSVPKRDAGVVQGIVPAWHVNGTTIGEALHLSTITLPRSGHEC
jgi:hypothetical protein